MNLAKQAAHNIFQQQEEIRHFTGYYKKLTIPAIPKGNQKQVFSLDEKVKPSKYSRWNEKMGVGKVLSFEIENGYFYYSVQWPDKKITSEREKDLIAA